MSFNIKNYVSDDHIESIGEIARGQANIIQALSLDNSQKDKEIKRLKEEYMILQNASDEVEEEKDKEIERLNNIINDFEEELEREIAIPEENTGVEHNTYIDIKATLEKVLKRLKELKGSEKE